MIIIIYYDLIIIYYYYYYYYYYYRWNVDSSCSVNPATRLWSCPWVFDKWQIGNKMTSSPNRTVAYLELYVPGITDGCDYNKFSTCTDQYYYILNR